MSVTGAIPLNYSAPIGNQSPANYWPDQVGFTSRHPGGANFVLADGSVRFLSYSIATTAMLQLVTYANGEVVNGEF